MNRGAPRGYEESLPETKGGSQVTLFTGTFGWVPFVVRFWQGGVLQWGKSG